MEFLGFTETGFQLIDKISNHTLLVVIGGFFILMSVFQWYMAHRQNNRIVENLIVQNDKNQQQLKAIVDVVGKISCYFEERAMRNVNIDQARSLIKSELEKSKYAIITHIVNVKQKNDLVNTQAVAERINIFIDTSYDWNISNLKKFDYQGKPLSSFMECHWKELIKAQALKDCENHEVDMQRLYNIYTNLFDSFKLSLNHKIDDIN